MTNLINLVKNVILWECLPQALKSNQIAIEIRDNVCFIEFHSEKFKFPKDVMDLIAEYYPN